MTRYLNDYDSDASDYLQEMNYYEDAAWWYNPYAEDLISSLLNSTSEDVLDPVPYTCENEYYWEAEWEWIEAFEAAQEAVEDFYEREYYSRVPSHRKENAGWRNDFLITRTYTRRYKNKASITKHRALRKARKETRSFERHREIDEAVSNYLEAVSWEDIFSLEAWPNT